MRKCVPSSSRILDVCPTLSLAFRTLSLICALLVVMIHVPIDETEPSGVWVARVFHSGICQVAVPFFFFSAGFFLSGHCEGPGWWRSEVMKRCKSLLIPYVVFGALYAAIIFGMVLWLDCLYNPALTRAENLAYVINPINILGLSPIDQPILRLLWFVRGLFVFVVLSPLVGFVVKDRRGLLFALWILGCLLGIYLMSRLGFPSEYKEMFVMGAFPLYGLFHFTTGMFMRFHKQIFALSLKVADVLLVIGLVIVLSTSIFTVPDWFGCLHDGIGPLMVYIGSIGLFVKFPVSIPASVLTCAFPVYLVHRFPLLPIRMLFKSLTGSTKIPWCFHFVTSLCLFAFSIWLVLLLKKLAPRTSRVIFGGR